jgi:hypothetical protein
MTAPEQHLERYRRAVVRYHNAEMDVTIAADAKALAIAEALDDGWTVRTLAAELDVTASRIQQLAIRGRAVRASAPADDRGTH